MVNWKSVLILTGIGILILMGQLQAQQPLQLSLDDAKAYAIAHNYSLRSSALDVEAARYQVKETTATGLPQIDGTISYIDNIGLPVQLVPGDFFGAPGEDIEVQFGTKYSASAGATINQLLFSGPYIVGLRAAKTYLEKSRQDFKKTQIEVEQSVSEAYFLVLATRENLAVIDSTLKITTQLSAETGRIVEAGFADETELDQLMLLVSELEVNRQNAQTQLEIAIAYLKFQMGMDNDTPLELSQELLELAGQHMAAQPEQQDFSASANIDFQLLKTQQNLAQLQLQQEKSHYLPTLSAFLNYQTQAQRPEWDFFDPKGRWFSSSMFGISMNIPIFSSGERSARVNQARLRFEQTMLAEEQLRTNLHLQYETILNELITAEQTFQNMLKNKELAEKIFRRTGVKYSEGMAGSLDLLNTHNQYLTAQSRYINAALNLLNQQTALQSLMQ